MKPVCLLVPGMLNDDSVWAEIAAGLRAFSEVRIAQVQTQSSIAAMARDAWSLLADVEAHVPLHVVGFSMGGYVAMEMLAHPQREIQGLALLDTSALVETAESRLVREKTLHALENDFPKTVDNLVKWNTHAASPELMDRIRSMMLRVGAHTAMQQTKAIRDRSDHHKTLQRLNIPVLVMCGEHDRVTPLIRSQELANLIPDAKLQVIPNAGHMLPMEQAQAVTHALQGWMTFENFEKGDSK